MQLCYYLSYPKKKIKLKKNHAITYPHYLVICFTGFRVESMHAGGQPDVTLSVCPFNAGLCSTVNGVLTNTF